MGSIFAMTSDFPGLELSQALLEAGTDPIDADAAEAFEHYRRCLSIAGFYDSRSINPDIWPVVHRMTSGACAKIVLPAATLA